MVISACDHSNYIKNGTHKSGATRFRCKICGKSWTAFTQAFDGMRLGMDMTVKILTLICEGMPVRGVSRVTGVKDRTIIDLCNTVGTKCESWMAEKIKGIRVIDVQADEIWQFVYCKQATAFRKKIAGGVGDSYCFTAIERGSKLLVAWHLGRRSDMDTAQFCEKLANATSGRFHLSTDGWVPYPYWVRRFLGGRVDYGTIVKIYQEPTKEDRRKYSPSRIVGYQKHVILGEPEHSQVCTSHAERMNGSIRHFSKRMGRLTYCFSKRWNNHRAAMGLLFAQYNFCRKHRSLNGRTPAQAHGLTDHAWTIAELLQKVMVQ